MLINGKRALAHIQKIHNIQPIDGADNIELVHVLGWSLIAKKGEFKDGDKAVYIEIDSKVPQTEPFMFLANKHFKVKTYKLNKFGVISQGLALPVSLFPDLVDLPINTDVTEKLSITYAVEEDNVRKSNVNRMSLLKGRKPKLFKNPIIKWLMKYKFGRWIILSLFSRKKDNAKVFPTHLCSKTDEDRIENLPFYLGTGPYSYTEKLDGSSATYALERKGRKFEFWVCSRNIRHLDSSQPCFYDSNIYWEQAVKYDIKTKLMDFLKHSTHKNIVIQGEIVGPSVQKKTYGLKERDFFVFNIIIDGKRLSNAELEGVAETFNLKTVPILGEIDKLPETMEEMKLLAEGKSVIGDCIREGLVYRKLDGGSAFKNVSNSYLLEKK